MTVPLCTKHEISKTDDNGNDTCCNAREHDAFINEYPKKSEDKTQDLVNGKMENEEKKMIEICNKKRKLLAYTDAPLYIKHNSYIVSGYRGILNTQLCIESLFWWTNETINIWSHIFGLFLFMATTIRDLCCLEVSAQTIDKVVVTFVLCCFQLCMLFSALYHTFSCRSQRDCNMFLNLDLFGIALSLLAVYSSGIYYAFWCDVGWLTFYMFTVTAIFILAIFLHIPWFNFDPTVKMLVFVGWAAYGVVPTLHWYLRMGGLENPLVSLLVPKVGGMYAISGTAFLIYITKIPERFSRGKFDYLGHSHQWWHMFVVGALYYWHCSGMVYLEYRYNHACAYPS